MSISNTFTDFVALGEKIESLIQNGTTIDMKKLEELADEESRKSVLKFIENTEKVLANVRSNVFKGNDMGKLITHMQTQLNSNFSDLKTDLKHLQTMQQPMCDFTNGFTNITKVVPLPHKNISLGLADSPPWVTSSSASIMENQSPVQQGQGVLSNSQQHIGLSQLNPSGFLEIVVPILPTGQIHCALPSNQQSMMPNQQNINLPEIWNFPVFEEQNINLPILPNS